MRKTRSLIFVAALAAALVGWPMIERPSERADAADLLAATFAAAEHAARLRLAAADLVGPVPPPEAAAIGASIAAERSALAERLETLRLSAPDAPVARIREHAVTLLANVATLQEGQQEWGRLSGLSHAHFMEIHQLHQELNASVYPLADHQYYYMMTGEADPGRAPLVAERWSRAALNHYRHLLALAGNADEAVKVLTPMTQLLEPAMEEMIQDQFISAAQRLRHGLAYFERVGGPEVAPNVIPLANRVLEMGEGEHSVLWLLRRKLTLLEREQRLVAVNERIGDAMIRELNAAARAVGAQAGGSHAANLMAVIDMVGSVDALVGAAHRLAGPLRAEELAVVTAAVAAERTSLQDRLGLLRQGRAADAARRQRLQAHADALSANVAAIASGQDEWQVIGPRADDLHLEIIGLRQQLNDLIAPVGDDLFHSLMAGGGASVSILSAEHLNLYRHLASLGADIDQTVRILVPASKLSVPSMAGMIEAQFILRAQRVRHSLEYLDRTAASALDPAVRSLVDRVLELGRGEGNVYEVQARRNDLVDRERRLLAETGLLRGALLGELAALVEDERQAAADAAAGAARWTLIGRIVLLVIAVAAVVGIWLGIRRARTDDRG